MPAPRKGVGGGPPVGGAPARRLLRGVHYAGQGAWVGDGGARDIGVSRDMGSLAAGNPSGSRLECMYVRSKSTPFRNNFDKYTIFYEKHKGTKGQYHTAHKVG